MTLCFLYSPQSIVFTIYQSLVGHFITYFIKAILLWLYNVGNKMASLKETISHHTRWIYVSSSIKPLLRHQNPLCSDVIGALGVTALHKLSYALAQYVQHGWWHLFLLRHNDRYSKRSTVTKRFSKRLWRHNFVFKRLQRCAQIIINFQLDKHKVPCHFRSYGYRRRHSQRPQTRSSSIFQTSPVDWGKLWTSTSDSFASRKWNTVRIWRVPDSGRK